jgi:2',3'-cyclic-nucleotide 2'-phosphodiesterase/3'-nucleotidase
MNLRGWDYHADCEEPAVGLTRTAHLIATARAEAEALGAATILVDNGDSLQGTPLGDEAVRTGIAPHPMMASFRHLGYDAIGLGNHDFNFGLDTLRDILADAPCPVLCSNIAYFEGAGLPTVPTAIIDRQTPAGGMRIGLLSVLPPQTLDWDRHLLHGRVRFDGMSAAAAAAAARLRTEGCDVVVALAHTGFGPDCPRGMQENALAPIAALDDVDAVVAGHSHLRFPCAGSPTGPGIDPDRGTVHGKPVAMAGAAGACLGVIDLDLAHQPADQRWRPTSGVATLRCLGSGASPTPEEPSLARVIEPIHRRTRQRMGRIVGHVDRPLHSYFSFFAPDDSLALVAAAQARALRPVAEAHGYGALPLLSATAPGKFGGRNGPHHYSDVAPGPVARRHVADLYAFPNDLCAMVLTGAQVRDWLEVSASLFHRVRPGSQGAELVNCAIAGYGFDVIHGLQYEIDISGPARFSEEGVMGHPGVTRIRNLRHAGNPVADADSFIVALSNYRANGGGHVRALSGAPRVPLPPRRVADHVRDYIASGETDPMAHGAPIWRFAAMPCTRVRVRTGPRARAHLTSLADRDVTDLGIDARGFLTLELDL